MWRLRHLVSIVRIRRVDFLGSFSYDDAIVCRALIAIFCLVLYSSCVANKLDATFCKEGNVGVSSFSLVVFSAFCS